jgi:hypothetical protein
MDIENNEHESNNVKLRISIGSALVIVGASLVGPAMNRMLQSEPWPYWTIILLIVGGLAIVIGLLILIVPPKSWKKIWQSILGFPTWLRETYIWYKYGPKCVLKAPVIDYELYLDGNERRYSTKVYLSISVSEKAKNYYPIRCDLSNISFTLYQKQGLMPVKAFLERNPLLPTKILRDKPGNTNHWIGLSWFPYNNPDIVYLDVYRRYKWVITNIYIYLGNLRKRRKLTKTGWAINVKKLNQGNKHLTKKEEQVGEPAKKRFFDKDKEYFVKLWQTTKEKWKQTVVITVGMVALLVVL